MILVLPDDTKCQIVGMFDKDGNETDEPDKAISVTAQLPSGYWISTQVGPGVRIVSGEADPN
jgi:hypothetical protein